MSKPWQDNLIEDDAGVREVLAQAHAIAVLGIKPESRSARAAYYVPEYMQSVGYRIIPVPVYYPDVREILGERIYRRVEDVPGKIDVVNVFRRPNDIPPHVDDIIAAQPKWAWFQLGIRNDEAAERLARAGIGVVQDRCMLADHRRLM